MDYAFFSLTVIADYLIPFVTVENRVRNKLIPTGLESSVNVVRRPSIWIQQNGGHDISKTRRNPLLVSKCDDNDEHCDSKLHGVKQERASLLAPYESHLFNKSLAKGYIPAS